MHFMLGEKKKAPYVFMNRIISFEIISGVCFFKKILFSQFLLPTCVPQNVKNIIILSSCLSPSFQWSVSSPRIYSIGSTSTKVSVPVPDYVHLPCRFLYSEVTSLVHEILLMQPKLFSRGFFSFCGVLFLFTFQWTFLSWS